MLALILAVCCSLAIGMIFKYCNRAGIDRVGLLTVNYGAALLVAAGFLWWEGGAGDLNMSLGLGALGVWTGALFIFGFFVLSLATEVAGMSLAIGVMRVSVVVPVLFSWWIWSEVPSVFQGLGLVVAAVAFFLIAKRDNPAAQPEPAPVGPSGAPGGPDPLLPPEEEPDTDSFRVFGILALLFFSGGAVDVSMKTFDELFAATNSRALFSLLLFSIAFLIGVAIVLWRRGKGAQWPSGAAVGWGILLGIVNYGSVEFLLQAIDVLSAPFVFPANNISLVIGAALLGVLVWGEHLSRLNWIGLGLAAVSLGLLNL